MRRVYVSLPLRGPSGSAGRDVLRGAELALERPANPAVELVLEAAGVRSALVVHDHDDGYGVPVGRMCADAARQDGLDVRIRPVWNHDEALADDVRGVGAVLYVGVAGSGAVGLWRGLHALDPELWLLGTDGVAEPWLAHELDAGAASRTRFFGAQRAPWAFYGYEAMALVLDAIAAGEGDPGRTTRAARTTRDGELVWGR